MLLMGVGTESDSCTDRITFDFKGDLKDSGGPKPGYLVEYRPADEAQTEDASGNHIPIGGKAFLVVRFEPAAAADINRAKLERAYNGPRPHKPEGKRWGQQGAENRGFWAVLP